MRGYERWILPAPRRMCTAETTLGGISTSMVWERGEEENRQILFLHGGGYATGSPALYRHITWRFAAAAHARLAAIDYRLAPEHPFPAALDDAVWMPLGYAATCIDDSARAAPATSAARS